VRVWDLRGIDTPGGSRSPVVLHSEAEARAILVALEPGQELGDHQVKEHAFITVVEGRAEVETGDDTIAVEPGMLLLFEPDERRAVSAAAGARVLLVLAPWPGAGHYRGEERDSGSSS
jgi:quercetin dioxygenase-like cupin family protein